MHRMQDVMLLSHRPSVPHEGPRRLRPVETDSRAAAARSWGVRVSWEEKVLETDSGGGCIMRTYLVSLKWTLTNGQNGKCYVYFTTVLKN